MLGLFKIAFIYFFHLSLNVKSEAGLKNGEYRIIQFSPSAKSKEKITSQSHLSITDEQFVRYWKNGDTLRGKIEWLDGLSFKLISLSKKTTDPTELEELIYQSFGEPIFELQEKKKRKIRFRTTYTGNLHITTSEGVIEKIR